ncbi:MAG TPA: enoyl-CoA hydratase-related protein [Pyrinomonadaceae bacterium]|jgi:methylglutaconyl-CoA hydratase|nr:enoyl-CoA hydratase-related protein [Pyrinomonadaceae bacterium]
MSVLNTISIEGVRVLELNRPEKRNALNDELVFALKTALSDACDDLNVASIVIRGSGKDFCSGADLSSLQKMSTATYEENLADANSLGELYKAIRKARMPVIAAVRGRALAGGCGLAMACDLILSDNTAVFGFPEVKIGFVPAMVAAIVRRNMFEKDAFVFLTLGYEMQAVELSDVGLVHGIFSDETFEDDAIRFAQQYNKLSRTAVEATKRLFYEVEQMKFDDAINRGAEVNAEARMSDDCRNGIARFLDKNPTPQ